MPAAADYLSSAAVPLASFGRSILSFRRSDDPARPVRPVRDELEAFQRHVAEAFADLDAAAAVGGGCDVGGALSIEWIQQLLDVFLSCFEGFRAAIGAGSGAGAPPPPMDRMIGDFFERGVRALDVCNAVRDGAAQIREWRQHLDIVAASIGGGRLAEGRLRRARKALAELVLSTIDDAGCSGHPRRHHSFGKDERRHRRSPSGGCHLRSQSWSVSRSWSAARQLQAMSNGLSAPRGHEVAATNGLAVAVYTMGEVLLFVMWALVAAIPCQDRGLGMHFSIPRSFSWSAPILSLHERILDDSKKKGNRHSSGLLKELHQMERLSQHLIELIDNIPFPITDEKEAEIKQAVREIEKVNNALKDGLDLMERQVREVFHRIVRFRTQGLEGLSRIPRLNQLIEGKCGDP